MIKVLQSPWLSSVIGALLYWSTTVVFWKPPPMAAPTSKSHPTTRILGPSWTFQNPELSQFVEELQKEKERLSLKETQLNELAQRLSSERLELNQATQAVYALQLEFDQYVTRVEEQESANLKKLSRMYASMEPANAVQILKQMEEPILVKILALMKDSEAFPILEAMGKQSETDAKQAALLTERLRLAVTKPGALPPANR